MFLSLSLIALTDIWLPESEASLLEIYVCTGRCRERRSFFLEWHSYNSSLVYCV